jgi:DNA-binding LacI/PurR family transcriptional regulator
MSRNVTIRDIARECGVSTATVSKVLNNRADVADSTRATVLAAVRDMGYVPSAAARQMRTGHPFDSVSKHLLEVILPDNSYMSLFHMELIRNLVREALTYGYRVVTSLAHQNMQVARAEGIIIATPVEHGFTVPVATADHISADLDVPGVTFDYRSGAVTAVTTALNRGYRNPILYCARPDPAETSFYSMYYQGFCDALAAAGISPDNHLLGENAVTAHDGYEFTSRLCRDRRFLYDLIVTTDDVAFGVYSALAACGISVPGDVGVLGCDGVPLSRYLTPQLSTVAVDCAELSRQVLARLIPMISSSNGPYPQKLIIPTEFQDRGSIPPR